MDNIKSLAPERGMPSEVDRSRVSAAANAEINGRETKFGDALKDSFDKMAAAKTGNGMPQSGMINSANGVNSGVNGAENAELQSRTLPGGLKLLLGGKEPAEESVMAFAKTQGLESGALTMLASGHGSSGQGGFSQSSNTQGTKLTTNRPQPAIVKLEAINLEGFSPEIAAVEARLNLPSAQASMLASSIALEGTTAHSQVAEVRIDLTEKSSVETKTSGDNGSESAAWRKHDQNQEMSQRLTDALGQRLSAQISRGAWRVEMDIHPKSLGRIEIQLEMKNGELEAHFNASKQATRDLLQESMPKLREALDQHGIDSAFIGLGAGLGQGQQGTDGNSTADSRPQRFNQMIAATAETVAEPAGNSLRHRLDSTGLDIEI